MLHRKITPSLASRVGEIGRFCDARRNMSVANVLQRSALAWETRSERGERGARIALLCVVPSRLVGRQLNFSRRRQFRFNAPSCAIALPRWGDLPTSPTLQPNAATQASGDTTGLYGI